MKNQDMRTERNRVNAGTKLQVCLTIYASLNSDIYFWSDDHNGVVAFSHGSISLEPYLNGDMEMHVCACAIIVRLVSVVCVCVFV